ncbi:MAG TPA: thioredoxin domain-containing protein, partial [Anaerolineae bacterium]
WQDNRDELMRGGKRVRQALAHDDPTLGSPPTRQDLADAVSNIHHSFDWTNGGWGGAPKFPQAMTLEFLLRRYVQTHDEIILRMVTITLDRMARGGIYDQLGGGFHRYATDDIWLVPHFEKMLYDNSQLARVYLHAYQVTGNALYKRITTEILDYVAREMTDPNGGFYSSQDADSEGHEGKFFVWTISEIRQVCGDDAEAFIGAYGVSERGNFEGHNILFIARDIERVGERAGLPMAGADERIERARRKLFERRESRIKPARDEKILTGWNGLMLAAFAEAARVLKREDYHSIAQRNAEFLLKNLRDENGRLKRSFKDGRARLNGYLEDYANLAEGLLVLYETTFDEKYFVASRDLAGQILGHFTDVRGGLYDTSDDHEELVTRPKSLDDNAVPSGNAMAVTVLLKFAAFTGEGRYADAAQGALNLVRPFLGKYPTGFAQWLDALDFALGRPKEIAIVGPSSDPENEARALIDVVVREYRPNQVVAFARDGSDSHISLLRDRPLLNKRATAYVCENLACLLPVNDPVALADQLQTLV